jgi:hypothetical protein
MPHGTKHGHQASVFDEPDPSIYMLVEPQPRPRLGNWFVFAIITGTLLALALVVLGNLIF